MALQMVPPTYPKLTLDLLGKLLHGPDPDVQLEAVRTLIAWAGSRFQSTPERRSGPPAGVDPQPGGTIC